VNQDQEFWAKHHHYIRLALSISSVVLIFIILHQNVYAISGTVSVGSDPGAVAFDPANGNIYVANQGYIANQGYTISVISGSNNTVTSTVSEGMTPQSIAFDSKGDVYFTNSLGMAFDPINGNFYVANGGSNSNLVSAISSSPTPTIAIVGSVRDLPTGVVFDSANDNIYVTNQLQHTVSVIGTTNSFTATINVGTEPVGVAFDPANNNIYVANQGASSVSVISGSTNNVTATINVGIEPEAIAFDSANNNIYVTNAGSNSVSVIDGTTNSVTATINVGANPDGIVFDSANNNIYVTNGGSNSVTVISGSNKIITITALSSYPNPSLFGQTIGFTATVSPSTATGTVTFTIDGTAGTPVAINGGIASIGSSSLTAGSHTITATYSGDTNDVPSTSSTITQTVYQSTTTTTLSSSANPSTVGQSITFTAMVSPNTATGKVTLTIDGITYTASLSGGQSSFRTSSLSSGTHSINVAYSGDTNYVGSKSTLTQAVTLPPVVIKIPAPTQNPASNVTNSAPTNVPTVTPTPIVPSTPTVTPTVPTPTVTPTPSPTPVPTPTVTPTTIQIPQWVHNNAKWWSEGSVSDNDFVQGIQYLIQEKIIVIPQTAQSSSQLTNQIPVWVKGVAGWWANGKISDDEFVKGIQFLIQVGIIKA